jgi:hypothetical protein
MRSYQSRIRDLTNTMVIAQSLFVALTYQLELCIRRTQTQPDAISLSAYNPVAHYLPKIALTPLH